jgi:hypothetical protein
VNPTDLEALKTVGRLETLGIVVRSRELRDQAKQLDEFNQRGGNRAIRRANERARRALKRSGAARTLKAGGVKVR